MRTHTGLILIAGILTVFPGCNSNSGSSSQPAELETSIDSVSYSFGFQNGQALRRQGMDDIDLDKLVAGMRDGLNERDPAVSQLQMRTIIRGYQMAKREDAMKQRQEEAVEYRKKGEDFLAGNKEKEGVITTESGLQYQVLEEGSGVSPKPTDTVVVHYRGTLLDGTEFDSSYGSRPVEFRVNGVIKGWTEGLQLMKQGAKYKFWIPSDLAYGDNPRPGGPIKPGQALVFEVELLEVK